MTDDKTFEAKKAYVQAVRNCRIKIYAGKPDIEWERLKVRCASVLINLGIEPNYSQIILELKDEH